MKFIDRQFMLPVFIGLSLTGVGATLLYLIYKKDDDPNYDRSTKLATSRQNVVEIKVPRQFVPVVIGRAGATIKDIQEKTETRLNFSTDDKDFPDRICRIRGQPECVRLARVMIENIIANQPVVEVYETYVPQRACGWIIGRGGEVIQDIQATSGAKIIVESPPSLNNPASKRRLIIKGTAEHIAVALALIEEKVREENKIREKLDVSLSSRLPRGKIPLRNTAVHTSDNQLESTDSLTPQVPEGLMEVYVSAVENPGQFWVQVVGPGVVALDKLVDEMTAYYNNEDNRELHSLKAVKVGQKVAAKFQFDEKWYRAEVIAKLEDNRHEVYFVDYGDHQTLSLQDMMELRTDFLSLRLQAIECSLANVKPREDEWNSEASDRFSDLSWVGQWKPLTAKVCGYKERALARGSSRREGSPIPCIDLYDKSDNRDINIGKELVTEVMAEENGSWSAASSTLSLTRRNNCEQPTTPIARFSETPPAPPAPPSSTRLSEKDPALVHQRADAPPKRSGVKVVEIDLTTPKKQVEIIDLVTPSKTHDATYSLITSERSFRENGSGDGFCIGSKPNKFATAERPQASRVNISLTEFASDLAEDSDDFELG